MNKPDKKDYWYTVKYGKNFRDDLYAKDLEKYCDAVETWGMYIATTCNEQHERIIELNKALDKAVDKICSLIGCPICPLMFSNKCTVHSEKFMCQDDKEWRDYWKGEFLKDDEK